MRRLLVLLALFLALASTACASDEDPGYIVGTMPAPTVEVADGEIERWWIDAEPVDCVGVFEQTCLVVREGSEDAERTWFYDSIDGLEVEEGTAYVVDVRITPVEDPPADASSLAYELVELVSTSVRD